MDAERNVYEIVEGNAGRYHHFMSINDPIKNEEILPLSRGFDELSERDVIELYGRLHLQSKGKLTYGSVGEWLDSDSSVDYDYAYELDKLVAMCETRLGDAASSVALAAAETMRAEGPETINITVNDKPVIESLQPGEDAWKQFADTAAEHKTDHVSTDLNYLD